MELEKQLNSEIAIINRTLAAFGVDAGTMPRWTTIAGSSFVAYGLKLAATQRISGVAALLPELSERISAARQTPTPVRLRTMPIALEVMHPTPRPLDWRGAVLRIGANRLLAGRNYSATPAQDCVIDLDAKPHVLVVGTTGSGKSTVLRMMLASLAYNMPPDALRLVLVDLKNATLPPFAKLPHVERLAYMPDDAQRAIGLVHAELQRRIRIGGAQRWQRLLLAIDELAQIDSHALNLLGSILSLGREMNINVVAATQHPTTKLIGNKANYPVRLVGQVVDADTAEIAAGRKQSGAWQLPGQGAFLYVDGPTLDRIQAYNLTADSAANLIAAVADKWSAAPLAPVRTSVEPAIPAPAPAEIPVVAPVRTGASGAPPVQFPLPRRAPTPDEAAAIRTLRQELGSLNQTILAVYGSKSSDTHRWVFEALVAPPEPAKTPQAPILRMAGVR